jgi:hypothetical protein
LRRLNRGTVDIKWKIGHRRPVFTGDLISHYVRDTTTKLYPHHLLEWEERLALKGRPLAQWQHSYLSTYAKPYPVSVAFLHEKSGSPTKMETRDRLGC